MMLHNALHCAAFVSVHVAMQYDTRIDSDSILAFPYIGFLHLIAKKSLKYLIRNFVFRELTQCKALHHFVDWPLDAVLIFTDHP